MKLLFQTGKEVLIKVMVQAISTYVMSVFMLPKSLIQNIARIINDFLQSYQKQSNKCHWIRQSKMFQRKGIGGLGFRDLECFNKALLAKQGWKLNQNLDSLVANVMRKKYYNLGFLCIQNQAINLHILEDQYKVPNLCQKNA